MVTVTAPVWLWPTEGGSWHFLTVPAAEAIEIKLQSLGTRRGFGSVRVLCAIGEVEWRTSVFPVADGDYLLPLKAEVRRRAGITAGDLVTVTVEPA